MIMYSIPPGHVGQVLVVVVQGGVVVVQGGVVGVANTTHSYPSSQTSQGFFVGQTSHDIEVAAQSTHSMTVTVLGTGQKSTGTCPRSNNWRSNRSRLAFVGGEVWMGLMYC